MRTRWGAAAFAGVLVVLLCGCAVVTGTPVWRGDRLERAMLTAADFPKGVRYDRVAETPGQSDVQGGPPAMLSRPDGCTDGLTRVIQNSAERGPGSAEKYVVAYDGARMVITVLSWRLDTDALSAVADRCATYETYFDPAAQGIPVTTTRVDAPRHDALAYEQAMNLGGVRNNVFFSFENVGDSAVFGLAFPTVDPGITVKGTLPQTFLDVATRQAERLERR
jgi:hypothetical protein